MGLDSSHRLSTKEKICMNCQSQFSRKNKKKNSDVICWKFYPAYLESKLDLSYFPEKISVGISCGLPARQKIHMKYQVLSSLKNNKKEIKMLSATILLSA